MSKYVVGWTVGATEYLQALKIVAGDFVVCGENGNSVKAVTKKRAKEIKSVVPKSKVYELVEVK